MSGGAFFNKLDTALNEANQKTKELSETIGKSGQALSDATNKAETLDKAIKDGADSAKQLFNVTNAVKMISAIGQISSSLITIKNLKTIWDDKDVSTG
jgi:seryl-tRNA synthetase